MFKKYRINEDFGPYIEVDADQDNPKYREERKGPPREDPAEVKFSRSRLGNWTIVWLNYAYCKI